MSTESPLSPQPRGPDGAVSEPNFSESVARLLDRIDYRLADRREEREAIFRLRYQAYLREGGILPNPSGAFSDSYDQESNAYLFGVYLDDELAGSVRIHLLTKDHAASPSYEAFSDILRPELDAGKTVIDTTRFVTDESFSRQHRGLPYAVLRVSWLAGGYFGADYCLAAVRVEHRAFYRRNFQHRLLCEARVYPGLARPLSLMSVHYPSVADRVHRRLPFFRSTAFERRMLFERGQWKSNRSAGRLLEDAPSIA